MTTSIIDTLTVREFAEASRRSTRTVREWCLQGKVDGAFKSEDGTWLIPTEPDRPTNPPVRAADCRIGMRSLVTSTVDLVLTDPPYGLDGMDEHWDLGTLRSRVTNGVIGGLPAGMKFDPKQGKRMRAFLQPVAKEWKRVLKPGGFALCFAQPRLSHSVATAMENAGFEIRDMLAWQHDGQQAKAFSQDHFVKRMRIPESKKRDMIARMGGRKTPQLKSEMEMIVLGQKRREGTFVENWMKYETGLIDVSNPHLESNRFPGQVVRHDRAERLFNHMTVKPVPVLRHLVRIFSKEGGIVLDTFAGTGSTGVACVEERREFIGFEIDEDMADFANQRIENSRIDSKAARPH